MSNAQQADARDRHAPTPALSDAARDFIDDNIPREPTSPQCHTLCPLHGPLRRSAAMQQVDHAAEFLFGTTPTSVATTASAMIQESETKSTIGFEVVSISAGKTIDDMLRSKRLTLAR